MKSHLASLLLLGTVAVIVCLVDSLPVSNVARIRTKRTSEPNKVAEKKSSKIVLAAAKPGLVNKKKRSLTNAKSSSQATFQNAGLVTHQKKKRSLSSQPKAIQSEQMFKANANSRRKRDLGYADDEIRTMLADAAENEDNTLPPETDLNWDTNKDDLEDDYNKELLLQYLLSQQLQQNEETTAAANEDDNDVKNPIDDSDLYDMLENLPSKVIEHEGQRGLFIPLSERRIEEPVKKSMYPLASLAAGMRKRSFGGNDNSDDYQDDGDDYNELADALSSSDYEETEYK